METGSLFLLLIPYCERIKMCKTFKTLPKQQILCRILRFVVGRLLEDIHRCEL
jgi:hypothetical protein